MTEEQLRRFLAKVDQSGGADACWLWTGATAKGYGRLTLNGLPRSAHRVAYELWVGPIPDGKELDHLCRVPGCVNPTHLEPVTHRVNLQRGFKDNARAHMRRVVQPKREATHCLRGHAFDAANTYTWTRPDGGVKRGCLICRHELTRASDLRRKARAA